MGSASSSSKALGAINSSGGNIGSPPNTVAWIVGGIVAVILAIAAMRLFRKKRR